MTKDKEEEGGGNKKGQLIGTESKIRRFFLLQDSLQSTLANLFYHLLIRCLHSE